MGPVLLGLENRGEEAFAYTEHTDEISDDDDVRGFVVATGQIVQHRLSPLRVEYYRSGCIFCGKEGDIQYHP